MNRLFYGDCFGIMQDHFRLSSVDLIYLDPPFNSNRQYNAIYRDETGNPLPDQMDAFCDMWTLDDERERAIKTMPIQMQASGVEAGAAELWKLWLHALRHTQPRLLAYLSYMAERLLVMYRILKPTGSLYFHCDPTVSHYVKPLLDAIFGHANFQNEIIWRRYDRPKGSQYKARRYGRSSDTILFYSKSGSHIFNADEIRRPLSEAEIEKRFSSIDDKGRFMSGRLLRSPSMGDRPNLVFEFEGYTPGTFGWRMERGKLQNLYDKGDFYFTSKGVPRRKFRPGDDPGQGIDNVWVDIGSLGSQDQERLGYATQKPMALLERIIKASSNKGDVVLDPFCGCATTLEAAHKLGRQWAGIDKAYHAINRVVRVRLNERLGLVESKDYTIKGMPTTVEAAQDKWTRSEYDFQEWAIEQVGGMPTTKRTADGGIDGRLYFAMPHERDLQSMIVEVKGGKHVNITHLRALKGVLDTDDALIAGLIIMEPRREHQTRNFVQFMARAGSLDVGGFDYPRMQMLTVQEMLDGQRFKTPTPWNLHIPQPRMPGVPV